MYALTSLLARDQVVPVRKIEEALQRQVVSGGEIDTVLLELGALPENVLAAYAAVTHGLRPATRDEVMQAPLEVVRIVPREVAEKHRLVPFRVEGRSLHVAVAGPLSAEVDQQLAFLLGFDLAQRVVTGVRLTAALAQHYGVEPAPRLARLAEKLRDRDAGEVPYVAPLASRAVEHYLPSERRRLGFGAFDDDEEDDDESSDSGRSGEVTARPSAEWSTPASKPDAGRVSQVNGPEVGDSFGRTTKPLGYAVVPERPAVPDRSSTTPRPATGSPRPGEQAPPAAPTEASPAGVVGPSAPAVTPSWRPSQSARPGPQAVSALLVALGGDAERGAAKPASVLPAPLQAPPLTASPSERRASGFLARLRGPLAAHAANELLSEAETRDEVLAAFFAFARQFFEYAALFVVQDDVAEGRESSGPGATTEELERLAVSLEGGCVFAEVRHDGVGRIAALDGTERDRAIAARLRRPAAGPCAVLPLTIRRRVVLMLYGDRDGAALTLDELAELLGVMPRVSEAFERLILRRKFTHEGAGTREARDTDRAPAPSAPVAPSSPPPPSHELQPDATAVPLVAARTKRDVSGALSVLSVPRSAPPPPRPRRLGAPTPAPFAAPRPAPVPTPIDAPSLASASTDASGDADVIVEMTSSDDGDDGDLDGVEEPASSPAQGSAAPQRPSTPPRPDGSYSVRGATEEVVTAKPHGAARRSSPPGAARASGRPAASSTPAARAPITPTASPASTAHVKKDTNPESPFSRDRRRDGATADEPSVIVDMGENVGGLIDELLATSPDEETNIVARLVTLGDAALPALAQEFPGPLWFDRRTAHARLPRGRDVSAVSRALVAFRERATPYLSSLLDAKDADVRFYATLISSEIVHGTLLEPLGRRVFDEDAGIRLLALDVLKRYQHLPEYGATIELLRSTARVLHRDISRRRIALRALAELRDAGAVSMLLGLLEDQDEGLRAEAHRALVGLTKQDFGDQRKRWEQWAEKHGQQHRIEWLIDALLHNDEPIRAAAGEELKRLTQEYYGYHPGSPRRERERVHGKYQKWWETEGKARF